MTLLSGIDVGGLETIFAPHTLQGDTINSLAASAITTNSDHLTTSLIVSLIRKKVPSIDLLNDLGALMPKKSTISENPLVRTYQSFPYLGQSEDPEKTFVELKDKDSTEIGSFAIVAANSETVMPQAFDSDLLTIFMNGVPTHELARCVPLMDIKVLSHTAAVDSQGRLSGVSLYKGIVGAASHDKLAAILAASQDPLVVIGANIASAQGMEMFLAPQTLMPPKDSVRDVIDRTRPLLSLASATIESNSMQSGVLAFKTGKLNFVLHDRARMADLADFLNPDFYSRVFFEITYGWSHPEATNPVMSPYGLLLNAMRRTELFSIQKTSYAMKDDGSVGIEVTVVMNGSRELNRLRISDNVPLVAGQRGLADSQRMLQELGARIRELRDALDKETPMFKEIRAAQVLTGAENPEALIEPDAEVEATIAELERDFQKIKNPNEKLVELVDKLKTTFGDLNEKGDTGGVLGEVRQSINSVVQQVIKDATSNSGDPFLNVIGVKERVQSSGDIEKEAERLKKETDTAIKKLKEKGSSNKKEKQRLQSQIAMLEESSAVSSKLGRRYVSLGQLLVHFVIKPILKQKKFDDVQIMCFPLNKDAGLAANVNISSFIIDTNEFISIFSQRARQFGTPDMQLTEFLEFVTTTFIDDPRSYMYGQQQNYKPRELFNPSAAPILDEKKKNTKDGKKTSDIEKINDALGGKSFRLPNVSYLVDSFITTTKTAASDDKPASPTRVLRIYIFDEHASPYSENVELLRQARDGAINDPALIERISKGDEKQKELAFGANAVKAFIMSTMPHATFGTAGSVLINAALTNIQDSSIGTVQLLRSGPSKGGFPTGFNGGTLPLRIYPGSIDVTLIGCPILEFGQQIFVDFSTLTTADQIYAVLGVTHQFEPGKFTTAAKLQAMDAWGAYETFAEKINNVKS